MAYQLALQARKSGHGSSTLPESFDSKPSKPVPKPRVNIRKSVSPLVMLLSEGKLHLILGGVFFHWCTFKFVKLSWILISVTNSWTPNLSDCLLFTLESFHNLHPSAPIGPPSFILALHWCHQVSVRCSGIILEYLVDVCLGPATVWQRCRLIFDLLSVCTVCWPPVSYMPCWLMRPDLQSSGEACLARFFGCVHACVCKKIKNHVESCVGNYFPDFSVHELTTKCQDWHRL